MLLNAKCFVPSPSSKVKTLLYKNCYSFTSHRSMEKPANINCTLLKDENYHFYFVKNCHGDITNDIEWKTDRAGSNRHSYSELLFGSDEVEVDQEREHQWGQCLLDASKMKSDWGGSLKAAEVGSGRQERKDFWKRQKKKIFCVRENWRQWLALAEQPKWKIDRRRLSSPCVSLLFCAKTGCTF